MVGCWPIFARMCCRAFARQRPKAFLLFARIPGFKRYSLAIRTARFYYSGICGCALTTILALAMT